MEKTENKEKTRTSNIQEEIEKVQEKEPNYGYKLIHNTNRKKRTRTTLEYVLTLEDNFYGECDLTLTHYKQEKPDQLKLTIKTSDKYNDQPKTVKINRNLTQGKENIPQVAIDLERESGYDMPYTKILLDLYEDFQETEQQEEKLFKKPEKKDLPWFTEDGKFVPLWLAQDIMEDHHFATHQENEQLYTYKNGIYRPEGEGLIKEEAQKRLNRYVKNHYVNETVEAVRRANYTPQEKFNNPEEGIVVKNGLLNLKNRELQPHSPEHIHITKIPWKYNPEAKCPEIKKFIKEIVNPEDVKLIQEMFGYCLLKDYPFAKTFMLLGSGANGKSTLLDLLEQFLGEENVATPSLQQLLNNRFARIELYGKLANIHADLSSKELENTGTFKMLSGKDTIRGEKKYQDAIQFKNHAKLIYSANELPRTTDLTDAFFRRWIVIEFPNQFNEGDEDTNPNLPHCLINEENMSGLLNWALNGLERIKNQGGFSKTKSRKEIKEQWIMETDSLRAFLNKATTTETDKHIKKDTFMEAYKNFCSENNLYTEKKAQVTKRIPSIKPEVQIYRPGTGENRSRAWKNLAWEESFIKENSYVQEVQPISTTGDSEQESESNNTQQEKSSQNTLDVSDVEENNKHTPKEVVEKFLNKKGTMEKEELEKTVKINTNLNSKESEKFVEDLIKEGYLKRRKSGKLTFKDSIPIETHRL